MFTEKEAAFHHGMRRKKRMKHLFEPTMSSFLI